MKHITNILFSLLVLTITAAFAQDTDSKTSAKVDSIYALQKKMYSETKNAPLEGKRFGIEINPFRILLDDDASTFSGTFSLFDVDRDAELAFPFYYSNADGYSDINEVSIDAHYRYFLGNTQNGFYISAMARFSALEGYLNSSENIKDKENKVGIGFGIGYRYFSYKGFYWGTSISLGRYLIGENNKFRNDLLDVDADPARFWDIEFFKFGYAF